MCLSHMVPSPLLGPRGAVGLGQRQMERQMPIHQRRSNLGLCSCQPLREAPISSFYHHTPGCPRLPGNACLSCLFPYPSHAGLRGCGPRTWKERECEALKQGVWGTQWGGRSHWSPPFCGLVLAISAGLEAWAPVLGLLLSEPQFPHYASSKGGHRFVC